MDKKTLQLARGESEIDDIECAFEDKELDAIRRFSDFARELCAVKIFAEGAQTSVTLSFDLIEGESTYSTIQPNPDDLIIYLHKLRPFVLQKEDTSFFRIANIIKRRINNAAIREFVAEQRDEYSGKAQFSQVQFVGNGKPINAEPILTKWLNAFHYHRDIDSIKELESLYTMLPREVTETLLISMLLDKGKAIYNIAILANWILGDIEALAL